MAQQTAVDWLFEQIPAEWSSSRSAFDAYQQAKQIEKEQIVNARESGKWEITKCINDPNYTFPTSEQYYNETYGTE